MWIWKNDHAFLFSIQQSKVVYFQNIEGKKVSDNIQNNIFLKRNNEIPLEKAGCWNYFTVGWVTSVMIKAIKSGLGYKDLYTLTTRDQSKESASRYIHILTLFHFKYLLKFTELLFLFQVAKNLDGRNWKCEKIQSRTEFWSSL